MEAYLVWGYIHILLFVFWLGADTGVFLSAVYAKNAQNTYETRLAVLLHGFKIDLLPRFCFALIFPVGLELTHALGLYEIPSWLFAIGWAVGVAWVAAIVVMSKKQGTPLANRLGRVQFAFEAIIGTFFVLIGLWSLLGNGPIMEAWFAVKIILFGCIFYTAMGLEISFGPFSKAFAKIGESGSTPELEAIVTKSINNTLVVVLTLYALIAVIAFLGKVKPF